MVNYLRPRRGRKDSAEKQGIVLKRGEVFFEDPIADGKMGSIKMGDGFTEYSELPYFFNVDSIALGFISDDFKNDNDSSKGTIFQLQDNNIINFRNNLSNNSVQFDDGNGNIILSINEDGTVSINTEDGLKTLQNVIKDINNDARYYTKQQVDEIIKQKVISLTKDIYIDDSEDPVTVTTVTMDLSKANNEGYNMTDDITNPGYRPLYWLGTAEGKNCTTYAGFEDAYMYKNIYMDDFLIKSKVDMTFGAKGILYIYILWEKI